MTAIVFISVGSRTERSRLPKKNTPFYLDDALTAHSSPERHDTARAQLSADTTAASAAAVMANCSAASARVRMKSVASPASATPAMRKRG